MVRWPLDNAYVPKGQFNQLKIKIILWEFLDIGRAYYDVTW